MRAIAIIPTYNEAENIGSLIAAVRSQPGIDGIVIVDDASPDGTGRIADGLAERDPGVHVIHRAGKLGLGTAYRAGFARALELGADRVLTMDADFSHRPAYLPALLDASQSGDLVIGSRYVAGGGIENWGAHRRALSWGANRLARGLLGLAARDCTSGFRCYHAELLGALDLDQVRSSDYGFLIELLYLCQREGATVAEVPIVFEDRRAGASKISRTEIHRALATVVRLAALRARRRAGIGGARRAADHPVA